MSLKQLITHWREDPQTNPNIVLWKTYPPRPAKLQPFPSELPTALVDQLHNQGIYELFSHQYLTWESVREGKNVVLVTGTASGKTLAYNLPILTDLLLDDQGCALYLFPTKALAQDQLSKLSDFHKPVNESTKLNAAIYDGETPQQHRRKIRDNARIILTNPDMLHNGILPHHTNWIPFFHNLRYVVIDEMHIYRGVFGSHVANVIRRLKRLTVHYDAFPQFILTSATIGNPQQLAAQLIEEPVVLIDEDGSSHGERHFLIYNPPVIEPAIGLRKSVTQESVRLGQDVITYDLQSVTFTRSRRMVEILVNMFHRVIQEGREVIRGYRSGYLPKLRREIEYGLRSGLVRMVVATNALELGIDIGGLEVAMIVGYPGTIAATWQQVGRAGRSDAPAIAVFIATPDPLDQFLAHHPDYFLTRSSEHAFINTDHLIILLNHIRCAAFELPFRVGEAFGRFPPDQLEEVLEILVQKGDLFYSSNQYYWMSDAYPAAIVSLRASSTESVVLQLERDGQLQSLGEVDLASAYWMVHPGAIYLHQGETYSVKELDTEGKRALLHFTSVDYYTSPLRRTTINLLSLGKADEVFGGLKSWGDLRITTKVVGFRKLRWITHENLGEELLELPPSELQTTGYWINISDETVKSLSIDGLWTNAPNDYGSGWNRIRESIRKRDGYRCQVCSRPEIDRQHDVHHKIPFRMFRDENGRILRERANEFSNLMTLCPECHQKAEVIVRVRSGLAGLAYVMGNLAPLFLMCDSRDLGVHSEPQISILGSPSVVLYDQVPAGIGFSQRLFEIHDELMERALELVSACLCEDGCPSCVGPAGENGMGGKQETIAIVARMVRKTGK